MFGLAVLLISLQLLQNQGEMSLLKVDRQPVTMVV